MRRTLSLLLLLSCFSLCDAQTENALKRKLFNQVEQFMDDWQRGDATALSASLAPEFLYVGENGAVPGKPVVEALTQHCHLVSYRLSEPTMLRTGTDTVVLIYSIHQDVTCFGKPQSPDVTNTDTLVRRDGHWKFVLTTSAPLHAR